MKFLIILAALITLNFGMPLKDSNEPPEDSEGIVFAKGSWDEIKQMAKEQNKVIFVDAYAVWCGPCKWMDKNVFPDAQVGAYYNSNFINYKFDMEKGEGRKFAQDYRIRSYPTYLFIDGDGKEIHRVVGSRSADQFVDVGRKGNA